MDRVIYFNINYFCNNHCLFCFSSSTNSKFDRGSVSYEELLRRIRDIKANSTDLIVINGGEPTLHPEFYKLIDYFTDCCDAEIVVYTNGVSLNATRLPPCSKITFVVPIHGPATVHNAITQNSASFRATMAHLCELDRLNFRYTLKFIINEQMIQKDFNIRAFLLENNLSPVEVVLARLNETKNSRENHYAVPRSIRIQKYLNCQIQALQSCVPLKLLDIPPCFVKDIVTPKDIHISQGNPKFFFNDCDNNMEQRNYYKQVKIGNHCIGCAFEKLCDLMSGSYLTLACHNGWVIEPE